MNTPSVRGRIPGRDSHLRAADADREQVADQLRAGHAEGRLDLDEFQHRLDQCYEAKTFGDLAVLVADLPRDDGPSDRAPAPLHGRGGRPPRLLALLALAFVLMAVSGAAWHHGDHPPFFLVFPILFLVWRLAWSRRARWSTGSRGGPGRWA